MWTVMCNGKPYYFHELHNMRRYMSEWERKGHMVYELTGDDSVDKAKELEQLEEILEQYDEALSGVRKMENIVGIGDSTGNLETALLAAIQDLQGYIDARKTKFQVYLIATDANEIYPTGTVIPGEGGFDTWFDASKNMDRLRSEHYYRNRTGEETYYVGIRKQKG
jgi:hypothetical protein